MLSWDFRSGVPIIRQDTRERLLLEGTCAVFGPGYPQRSQEGPVLPLPRSRNTRVEGCGNSLKTGGRDRTRTCDLLRVKQAL